MSGVNISNLVVVAGTSNDNCFGDSTGRCIIRYVSQIIPHPEYSVYTILNDIALVLLNQDLPLVTMPNKVKSFYIETTNIPSQTMLTFSGWGATATSNNKPVNTLQQGQIPVQPADVCNQQQLSVTTPDQLCIGSTSSTPGVNLCYGDAGSPAFYTSTSTNNHVLVAIASYGGGACGGSNHLGVWTNVKNYITWISGYTTDLQFASYSSGGGSVNPPPTPSPSPTTNNQCVC